MVSIIKVFTINTPQKHELCCAICNIINSENDTLIYPEFCLNKLKCRQFLREMPQAMAAPITSYQKIRETGGIMYIIVEKELFEDSNFQHYCNMQNIQVMDLLSPIPTYIYKMCLLYTLECKLTSQWNKVGLYLVKGQNFLSSTENVNAIKMNIKNIYDDKSQLYLEAVNLKIPFIRHESQLLKYDNLHPPVHVLPSMRMANVLCVSKNLKENHPFKNYEELREYWTNMHGYILPEYEEGLLFYNVKFFYFKQIFVYPATCLTSGSLKVLPFVADPVPLIYNFVTDLKRNVVKLCGSHFDIYPEDQINKTVNYTPIPTLSRSNKILTNDTGYDTQSRKTSSNVTLLMSSTCDIPTKRPRLSLVKSHDSLICEAEIDDFDLNNSPTCTFIPRKTIDKISTVLCDADNTVFRKPDVQNTETKSCYFNQEKQENKNKSVELTNIKQEKESDKLSLREKLLKTF